MECYVLTLEEYCPILPCASGSEHTILGIYENKNDIWSLMYKYYNENQGNFEKQNLTQFEDSEGNWEMKIVGHKGDKTFILRGEYRLERITASIKELLNDLNIII